MNEEFKSKIRSLCKDYSSMNVEETLSVLKSNPIVIISWGCSDFLNVNNVGLLFKVRGNHHQGFVLITLSWMDLYDVHIIDKEGNSIDQILGLYDDCLLDAIDKRIEYVKEYKNK